MNPRDRRLIEWITGLLLMEIVLLPVSMSAGLLFLIIAAGVALLYFLACTGRSTLFDEMVAQRERIFREPKEALRYIFKPGR